MARFEEDTPLYPICRAWMQNQPRNPQLIVKRRMSSPEPNDLGWNSNMISDIHRLPPPVGPMVSRVPSPLPDQLEQNKDNINLNYVSIDRKGALFGRHIIISCNKTSAQLILDFLDRRWALCNKLVLINFVFFELISHIWCFFFGKFWYLLRLFLLGWMPSRFQRRFDSQSLTKMGKSEKEVDRNVGEKWRKVQS